MTQNGDDLKKGMLAGAVFPLVLILSVIMIKCLHRKEKLN